MVIPAAAAADDDDDDSFLVAVLLLFPRRLVAGMKNLKSRFPVPVRLRAHYRTQAMYTLEKSWRVTGTNCW